MKLYWEGNSTEKALNDDSIMIGSRWKIMPQKPDLKKSTEKLNWEKGVEIQINYKLRLMKVNICDWFMNCK